MGVVKKHRDLKGKLWGRGGVGGIHREKKEVVKFRKKRGVGRRNKGVLARRGERSNERLLQKYSHLTRQEERGGSGESVVRGIKELFLRACYAWTIPYVLGNGRRTIAQNRKGISQKNLVLKK